MFTKLKITIIFVIIKSKLETFSFIQSSDCTHRFKNPQLKYFTSKLRKYKNIKFVPSQFMEVKVCQPHRRSK